MNHKSLEFQFNAPIHRNDDISHKSKIEDGHDYMRLKNFKVAQQLLASETKGNIFHGVIAFVSSSIRNIDDDRYSDSTSRKANYMEIAALILKFGGETVHHVDKTVTHFISPSIPVYYYRKLDQLKDTMSLVSPQWVIDSVLANKRLSTVKYMLIEAPLNRFVNENPIQDSERASIEKGTLTNETISDSELCSNPKRRKLLTTMENPNFVKDYMASSRLHYLSTWKAALQKKINDMIASVIPEKLSFSSNDAADIIMHIDMDAFFVSVSTRHTPEIRDKPIVVSHGGNRAVCASVNYAARKMGASNGDWLGGAKELCGPDLVVLPYDYDAYESVSMEVYQIFVKYCQKIQVSSCDEAFLNVSDVAHTIEEALSIGEKIRSEVYEKTGCHCSVGIGNTKTLATMALKRAKPNGIYAAPTCCVTPSSNLERVASIFTDDELLNESEFVLWMAKFNISQLPGIGYAVNKKLRKQEISTVGDIQKLSLPVLKQMFGDTHGVNIFLTCRGIDIKPLAYQSERRSISVEISYGVRFSANGQVLKFIKDIVDELCLRAINENQVGKTLTMNMYKRKKDVAPLKGYLGHGPCTIHSKSITTHEYINTKEVIYPLAIRLYKQFNIKPEDVRGIGLHLAKLKYSEKKALTLIDFMTNNLEFAKPQNNNLTFKKPQSLERNRSEISKPVVQSQQGIKPIPKPRKASNQVFASEDHEKSLESILNSLSRAPTPVHIEILQQFCIYLCSSGNLEFLARLIRRMLMYVAFTFIFLVRRMLLTFISCKKSNEWNEVLDAIITISQKEIVNIYGYTLDLS